MKRYETYSSLAEVAQHLSYGLPDPDSAIAETLGLTRASFIRWLDDGTDLVAFLYPNMRKIPGTIKGQRMDGMVLIFQGIGPRCDSPQEGDRGDPLDLADGRVAEAGTLSWHGGPQPHDLSWVSWEALDGRARLRIDGVGYDLGSIRLAAQALAKLEPE